MVNITADVAINQWKLWSYYLGNSDALQNPVCVSLTGVAVSYCKPFTVCSNFKKTWSGNQCGMSVINSTWFCLVQSSQMLVYFCDFASSSGGSIIYRTHTDSLRVWWIVRMTQQDETFKPALTFQSIVLEERKVVLIWREASGFFISVKVALHSHELLWHCIQSLEMASVVCLPEACMYFGQIMTLIAVGEQNLSLGIPKAIQAIVLLKL